MPSKGVARFVRDGDTIVVGQVLGEPTSLLEALFEELTDAADVRVFVGMSLTDVFHRAPAHVRLVSSVGMEPNGRLITAGRMELIPCHMSDLPWLVTVGPCRADVAAILVSPPDVNGNCSLGVTSDYIWHAVQTARTVIAEINPNVPVVGGDTTVHISRIDIAIHSERALPEYDRVTPSPTEILIGQRVAAWVTDGSCIQVGIGRLAESVLRALADHRHLGIHAGMVSDTMLEMVRDGVVDNTRKRVDTGLSVAGSILGSAGALRLAAHDPTLRLRSIAHTHSPAVIEQLDRFVCINSAIEVDLLGQVNSEIAAGRYVGAVAGSVDYLRSSIRSSGGHSVLALPSVTGRGAARIIPRVGHVTATRSDVDVIVTEHGVAELRGASTSERAARIIAIAAPEHQDELKRAASEMGL
jgi:acyl-CoA hydrolase